MKIHLSLIVLSIIIICHAESFKDLQTKGNESESIGAMRTMMRRGLRNIIEWFRAKAQTEDSFVGRCLGAARKLKMIMPLIIFKLGVMMTILVFLTIFSLKGLGLLVLLLLINSSGLVSKLALLKHEDKHGQPQNFHFHIHPDKDVGHKVYHPDLEHYGWSDKDDGINYKQEGSVAEKLKYLSMYEPYER